MDRKTNYCQFKFSIEKWEKELSSDSKTPTIIYQVEVESILTAQKWSLSRSLESLQTVINKLTNICLNLPFPPKMIESKDSPSAITLLGKNFELYLKSLLIRGDIANSIVIAEFFELRRHYPDIDKCQIKKLCTKRTKYQVSDMYYNEHDSLLFVGFGKKLAIGFIENTIPYYMLNFFTRETLGQILVYKLNKDNLEPLVELDTASEVSKLKYYQCPNSNYLIAAYYNGTIDVYECPTNYSTYISSQFLKLINTIEVSNTKLISLGFNVISHYIYAIPRKDKAIHVLFFDSNKKVKSVPISDSPIIGFDYNDNQNHFISYNEEGLVTVAYIENDLNIKKVFEFKSNFNDQASLFKVDYDSEYIFIGSCNGKLFIYSFNDKFRVIAKAYSINLKHNRLDSQSYVDAYSLYEITEVTINPTKKELMIGLANGAIQFFSHAIDKAEYAVGNNQGAISKIALLDSKSDRAVVSSFDQSITLISIPSLFMSEKVIFKKDYNEISIFNYPSSQPCLNELNVNKYKDA